MKDDLPTAEDVGKALQYLSNTDEKWALLVARREAVREEKARIIAIAKVASGEKSDAAKSTEALASDEYGAWITDYENVVYEVEHLKAVRLRMALSIDVWRSLNSARNKGNII